MHRALVVPLVVLVAAGGYVGLDIYDRAPGILTLAEPRATPTAAPTTSGPSPPVTSGQLPSAAPTTAAPLTGAAGTAPLPTRAGLAKALARALHDPGLGSSVGVAIRDAATGAHLYDVAANVPRVPASTTKLLTAAAVMATLEPDEQMVTRAVQGATQSDVVLVAGGDTLLNPGKGGPALVAGRAGLADLAALTATSLRTKGVGSIRLQLDETLAAGATYAPTWLPPDISAGLAGPVAMIGLSTQRPHLGRPVPSTPGLGAAKAFRAALAAQGLTVAPSVARVKAPPAAVELGAVSSAPVSDVLALALAQSDNALTESLARRAAAHAGARTAFPAVAAFVLGAVGRLGIDTTGVKLVDTSGLSRGTAMPTRVVADVLALAATGTAPGLQEVVARLPVAGLSGTLSDRFRVGAAHSAAGIARAKTGTLTGASGVGGTVVDRDGRLLVFAILADKLPPGVGTLNARAALDRFVATLAACGCR